MRVAARVVKTAQKHKSKITFLKDGKQASAQSILELLVLGAAAKSQVTVIAEGEEEKKALNDIEIVLMDGAGI